ncbi:hypothetical protein BK816_07270 [Boudabousia tangfeifanii]|uniref:Uncharacterized protein n=1 Tax=Boudabousia tangfeifanii TaxID=1912795 RepID=A0A1D9MLH2_9ACTO|nr:MULTISPECIES: hypothetical protein [Boudabousia]AOZ73115.1 hypothetical protein BK816_07270 [Boudabousia tangfeifanii]OKL46978.1 hypothetical protein BSR28_06045 [Boudabousia liubingyangii]
MGSKNATGINTGGSVFVPVKNAAGKLICRADMVSKRIEISHQGQIMQIWFDTQGMLHTHQVITKEVSDVRSLPPPLVTLGR